MRSSKAVGFVLLCAFLGALIGCAWLFPHTVSVPRAPTGPAIGTTGEPLTFSTEAASCSRGHPVEYRYNWDDGTYSTWGTSTDATHTWSASGTYEIRAQARCGEKPTLVSDWSPAKNVVIEEAIGTPPVAVFTFAPASPITDEPVTFDAGGSTAPDGVIDTYAWDFGDGATDTGVTVTHTYASPGTYPVLLTVTDDHNQVGTATQNVVVGAAPEEPAPPLAWGYINLDGTVGSGSPGLVSTWNAGAQLYEISIPETNYTFSNYITLATPIGSSARTATTSSGGGKLYVRIINADGAMIQSRFHFVTYDEPVTAVAWGYIQQDGTVWRGTPGLICTWTGDWIPHYRISIPGEAYACVNYITLATPIGLGAKAVTTDSMGGDLVLYFHDEDGIKMDSRFHFVTYDEPPEPLAWGHIEEDGAVARGSPGIACSWNATLERYEVTVPGEHYHFSNYITLVTAVGDDVKLSSMGSIGGKLTIYIADENGDRTQSRFHFVVHKP